MRGNKSFPSELLTARRFSSSNVGRFFDIVALSRMNSIISDQRVQ